MPNKKKKEFGRCSNDTATSNLPQHNCQAKRKQWTDHQMQEAIDDVVKSHPSTNAAAKKHGVPPATLKDRLGGQVMYGTVTHPLSSPHVVQQ